MANSLPTFDPSTDIGKNIGKGRYCWQSLQSILLNECVIAPTDTTCKVSPTVLSQTTATIAVEIPVSIQALDGDSIAQANKSHNITSKSTDAYTWIFSENHFLLVECKFKVFPSSSVMCDRPTFDEKIGDKFNDSRQFLTSNQCHYSPDCVVVFNNASIEKIKNMFEKLKQTDRSYFNRFKILGVAELAKIL